MFFVNDFFENFNFKALFLLKWANFLSAEFRVLVRDMKRVIFDQWPKLNLGFDVEPEIQILKVIYYTCR